jgi:hypothetical protein
MKKNLIYLLVICTAWCNSNYAQTKKDEPTKQGEQKKEEPKKEPKPYKTIVDTSAITQKGLFVVHKVKEKYFIEISDDLLGKDFMAITRYSKTPAGGAIFGGEEINRQVLKFEKGLNHNMLLRSVTYVIVSPDEDKPISRAVKNSSADPIVGNFDILAYKKDETGKKNTASVIDMTSIFDADVQVFSLNSISKQLLNVQAFQKEKSFLNSIKSFPLNVEVRTTKTFTTQQPLIQIPKPPTPKIGVDLPAGLDAGVVTFEFNTSFIALPELPMRKRFFDKRVGYFANGYDVYKEASQKSETENFAVRWRLEPKNEADALKQSKGELIEPKKPIVYYIDPATPEKWKSYIKQGVNDWKEAFEFAGWKNAIRGEYWPENDPSMSLEDARYSVLRYFASDIENAYGPNVHDPRTGEILESHIGWYHNIMSLLRDWYLIQTAAVDPKARTKKFDEKLMGELIRFVSSHEVGHTLGLRHNMGASNATPVEMLRNAEFQKKNGHTSSIMDYARFNYVAQPEDSVKDLFPRIGDYDKWAIKWGYSYFKDAKNDEDEKKLLNEMVKDAYKNPRLRFGTESSAFDPRFQTEDLGDNAMKASEYGIKNLKRILPNLKEWTKESGEDYSELKDIYAALTGQFARYMGHVTKNIGGIYEDPKTYDMDGEAYNVTPVDIQVDAVKFLNEQLFKTPTWLLKQDIFSKTTPDAGLEFIKSIQDRIITNLFSYDRLVRLIESASINTNNYSADRLFSDIKNSIFSDLNTNTAIDIYKRNLQKVLVTKFIDIVNADKTATAEFNKRKYTVLDTDIPSIARGNLMELKTKLKLAVGLTQDKLSKYHLQDLIARIEKALSINK